MKPRILEAARALKKAHHAVAVTGAGASVESGIPDFRSPNGIWETYPPDRYATIEAFLDDPDRVWQMWFDLGAMLGDVLPNPGHHALAELEAMGHLHAIITQNIDNLHQAAGNRRVIEYHGNARRMRCLDCDAGTALDLARHTGSAPHCVACGGIMKPDVVLFGEIIPELAMTESELLVRRCDFVLIVGTSATVYPAAGIPATAKQHGAFVVECNVEETDFTCSITDIFIQGKCGETLPLLAQAMREL
ncbi:MAG: NAD-dependent deacylase [Candidatus Hydrogenedentes bacterium]|nr:NAD-dependent deacylase [Candidatus Hydrogenedentota bacterium]